MPILVLAARPMRPFALKVYRSFSFKKMGLSFCIFSMPVPHTVVQYVPYLVFLSLNSRQSCHCVSPRLNVWAQKVVWPVSSPTATLSFDLLIALNLFCCTWQSISGWQQSLQVLHLCRCSCLKWLLMTSLPTAKGILAVWSEETSLVPSLANSSASPVPIIPWCPGIHTKVTWLDQINFPALT